MKPDILAILQRFTDLVYEPHFTLATKRSAREVLQQLRKLYLSQKESFTGEIISTINQCKSVMASRTLQEDGESKRTVDRHHEMLPGRRNDWLGEEDEDLYEEEDKLEPWIDAEWWDKFGAEVRFYEGHDSEEEYESHLRDNDHESYYYEYQSGIAEGLDAGEIDWESLDGD